MSGIPYCPGCKYGIEHSEVDWEDGVTEWQCILPEKMSRDEAIFRYTFDIELSCKITNKMLLELICLMSLVEIQVSCFNAHNIPDLKDQIFKQCVKYGTFEDPCNRDVSKRINEIFKQKIQELIKGDKNGHKRRAKTSRL